MKGIDDSDPTDASLPDDPLWARLDRFLAGECSAEEASEVRGWLAEHPTNQELLESARRLRRIAGERPPVRGADAAWRRAAGMLELGAEREPSAEPRAIGSRFGAGAFGAPSRTPARRGWAWAGAIAAGLVLAVLTMRVTRHPASQVSGTDPRAATRTYATARAQRAIVRLSDGTQVVLGPESRLDLSPSFGGAARDVTLSGQAYFTVVHDSTKPFRVRARGTTTEDVGTAFSVRGYPADPSVRVVVAEGAVRLGSTPLVARDVAVIDTAGRTIVTHAADVERYLFWTDGRLVLDGMPLAQAAAELSRWYDLDVRLADEGLGRVHVTGTFGREPVDEVLEALTAAAGLRYERQGQIVTIRRGARP